MFLKPSAKPLVFGSVNPFAKDGKSLKQNKTKQEGVGLVLKTKPNPLTCLSVNLTSKVISLASSLCTHFRNARICDFRLCFQQVFHRVIHIACLGVIVDALGNLSRARRDTTMPNLRQGATD